MKLDPETRDRLLTTAKQLFAERGFKRVTVREICHAANANVAAVNYHFGDKLGLYREVLQSAVNAMKETNEAAKEAGKGQPPEEQLRRYLKIFLPRILKPGNEGVHRLITREINDPTPALDILVEQGVRPRIEYLVGVIAEMVAGDPKDPRILRCVASIQSQAISYMPNPIAARLGFGFKPTSKEIETAVEHIATFSIAGIHAIGRMSGARSH